MTKEDHWAAEGIDLILWIRVSSVDQGKNCSTTEINVNVFEAPKVKFF